MDAEALYTAIAQHAQSTYVTTVNRGIILLARALFTLA